MSDELLDVMRSLLTEMSTVRQLLEEQARSCPEAYQLPRTQSIYPTADGGMRSAGFPQVLFTGRGGEKSPVVEHTDFSSVGQSVSGFLTGISLNYNDQGRYPGAALRVLIKVAPSLTYSIRLGPIYASPSRMAMAAIVNATDEQLRGRVQLTFRPGDEANTVLVNLVGEDRQFVGSEGARDAGAPANASESERTDAAKPLTFKAFHRFQSVHPYNGHSPDEMAQRAIAVVENRRKTTWDDTYGDTGRFGAAPQSAASVSPSPYRLDNSDIGQFGRLFQEAGWFGDKTADEVRDFILDQVKSPKNAADLAGAALGAIAERKGFAQEGRGMDLVRGWFRGSGLGQAFAEHRYDLVVDELVSDHSPKPDPEPVASQEIPF